MNNEVGNTFGSIHQSGSRRLDHLLRGICIQMPSVCCRATTKFENIRRLILGFVDADFCKEILVVNSRSKALDDIYRTYMFWHRSDLNFQQTTVNFCLQMNNILFKPQFLVKAIVFRVDFDDSFSEFHEIFKLCGIISNSCIREYFL